ncbi:heat-shock protein [Longibacter salinarum]|uniref:Heat-shock protein n=1 Tax=Longibacter salinarum TaxID=1850348 RepID=A0A2A8D104_9BACT|nr:Hsp20/alpha crystallin family protein [Longibacter salinarum]PEN14574.1 heat-shock protein [Longibacter salinarum]
MTKLIRTPNRNLSSLQQEIDRLFEGFFPTRSSDEDASRYASMWSPRTDLIETPEAYRIELDVPGMNRDDIHISYQDDRLTVSGERAHEAREENEERVRVERTFGNFFRSFTLPSTVSAEQISAQHENGVLTITVPKAEESKPRRIEIK